MKISTLLTLTGIVVSSVFNAQTKKEPTSNSGSLKQEYIKNQGYLSKRSGLSLQNPYGDSLAGFDEKGLTEYYMAAGVGGSELVGHIQHLKRQFINDKYKINQLAPSPYSTPEGLSLATSSAAGKKKGGSSTVNVAPCVNEGFELNSPGAYTTALGVTGWTVESHNTPGNCNYGNWVAGSPAFSLVSTPLTNWPVVGSPIGVIPHSPLGGTVVAQLNDAQTGDYEVTRIKQTFPITASNALFQFAYAGYWQDGGSGHNCCQQPGINVRMYDCTGAPLACVSLSLFPGSGCQSAGVTYTVQGSTAQWTNWQVKFVDFTPYIGTCITVEFFTADCSLGGHYGTTLLDVMCGGQNIGTNLPPSQGGTIPGPVSFCAGSNVAVITAPTGYNTYQWISPITGTVPPPQGTMSTLSVTNPVPGSVYTVNLVTASNCQYVSTNTIVFSSVNVAGIGSSPTCPNGSSGSATVAGNGSGAGYTYTWVNSSNSVVGTQSIVSGLSPGVYSVTLGGFGAVGCGTAVSSVTIGVEPPSTVSIFNPYCGSEAYLNSPMSGSNFQWYSGTSPITSTLGTMPNYTVTNPSNGAQYWVSYTTSQGCKDSVRFTLVSSPPGLMTVPPPGIKLICPGASNGTAAINLSPANGAPANSNYFTVAGTGSNSAYTASAGPVSANIFTVNNLATGMYSVTAFDGACKYNTVFNVVPLLYDFTVTPLTRTLCPGSSVPGSITFTSPPSATQYSYSWTPTSWLVGGNGSFQNTIITPTGIPNGQNVTTVFTVVVTPTAALCPKTKTIAVTAVNPPTPTISAINPFCNTSNPVQIQATPGGGTFINAPSTPGLIGAGSGVISPTLAPFGVNNFTYAASVYTCVATQTASFEVSQFFSAALTSPTVAPRCVTSPQMNLMNLVQQTNGSWSGEGVQGNFFNAAAGTTLQPGANKNYQLTYSTQSSPNPTVCPASSNISINVTNTLVPHITPVDAFCTNAPPITMTVNQTGGGWSGSNISTAGVINPSNFNQMGPHTVTYSVNLGPCLNTASTTFNVSRFNSAALTGSVYERCHTSNPVNLMSIVQNTTGSWSGTNVQNNSFNPAGLFTSVYTLTYTTASDPDALLCPDESVIDVAVLNPQIPNIADIGPLCSQGEPVQLSVNPGGGKWTTTSFLNAEGIFSPSLAAVGNNAVQYVTGTPTCSAQQTKFISVEGFVSAQLSSPHLPPLCNTGSAINLMPYTYNNTGTWQGPGILGSTFDPALAGQGDFVLTYTTASIPSGLCPDASTVAVNVFSLQVPKIASEGPFCTTSMPVQLTADVQGGMYGGANTGAISKQGLFIPASGVIGDNIINYTISSGPCVAYAQTTISVERFVSADFHTPPPTFCKTDKAVNMDQYVVNPGGFWSGSGIVGKNMFHPQQANPGSNNEITYRTHSMPTATLCPDEKTIRIKVVELPKLTPVANDVEGCEPHEVFFNLPNVNPDQGQIEWILGDGGERKEGSSVSHIYNTPGTYSVQVNYSYEGCSAYIDVPQNIRVHGVPQADFRLPEEVLISSPDIQLINTSSPLGDNKYTWQVDGFPLNSDVNPVYSLPAIGKYQITLTAENAQGCKDEIVKTIEVKNDFNIYIPTSFSPNFDGLNDRFHPVFSQYGLDARSFEMEIFDRWGHLIYRTTDFSKGWDGSVGNKGEPLQEGVYIYKIRYKDMDGNAYSKMGHVSLLK